MGTVREGEAPSPPWRRRARGLRFELARACALLAAFALKFHVQGGSESERERLKREREGESGRVVTLGSCA